MKTRYIFTIAVVLLSFGQACETTEKIDDFPLRPSKMVVNSFFTADSVWEIQVSKSLSVLDNADLQFIKDAKIKIFKEGQLIDSIKNMDNDGFYRSYNTVPEKGKNYSIEVSTPSFKKAAIAKEVVPLAVPISNLSVTIRDSSFYRYINYDYATGKEFLEVHGNVEATLNVTIADPPNEDNYYQLQAFYINTWKEYYNDTIFEVRYYKNEIYLSSDDPIVQDGEGYSSSLFFTDEIFNGQRYQLKLDFEDWDASYDREYIVELTSINKSGYLYKRSVSAYLNSSGDPFSEPVLIYSNIENGYGIFAGYSNSNSTVKLFE